MASGERRKFGKLGGWVALACVCVHILQLADAQLQAASPVSCTRSSYVILGSPFQLQLPNGTAAESCSFWIREGGNHTQVTNTWMFVDSQYTFYRSGEYNYNCDGVTGLLSVMEAQYSIALCESCSNGQYTLNTGEVLRWSVAERSATCTTMIRNTQSGESVELEPQEGIDHYQFKSSGSFELFCAENNGISATVIVVSENNTNNSICPSTETEDESSDYKALLYSHAGIMGITFGILLPLGAFLAHHEKFLAHKIMQPTGIILALVGFVMIIVYVQLTTKQHFQFVIHGVVGLTLLLMVFLLMPFLLLKKQWRMWHRRCGHIIAFFGMGNVLVGLTILPAPNAAAITLCVVYGIWLVLAVLFYVVYSSGWHSKEEIDDCEVKVADCISRESSKTQLIELGSRRGSSLSSRRGSEMSTRGPQPLTKNVISEQKMIQLRKKSLDFFEARQHRQQLDRELRLQQQESTIEEETEIEKQISKQDSVEKLNASRNHLQQASPERPTSPFPPYVDSNKKPEFHTDSGDSSEDERDSSAYQHQQEPSTPVTPGGSSIVRAHTFVYGKSKSANAYDSDGTSSRGGSLRITRHSKRARPKVKNTTENSQMPSPDSAPSISNSNSNPPAMESATATRGRRRKAALVPPIITTTPAQSSPRTHGILKQPSVEESDGRSPSPARRGVSPTPSAGTMEDGVFEHSPRPRKKKVSVAHIEATVVPPTPVNLQPPPHMSLSRSGSFSNTLHAPTDVFADNALRSVMQMSQDAIVCANSVGDIVFWSAGAVKMFGYTPGEAIGSSLEMIIPQNYKEKHRNGITRRTDNTLKYIRKHSYTPEEQKHARLYAVHGVSKNGHEFPVEVNVTSFVIDGEMFYTGIVSELAGPRRFQRSNSVSSSASDTQEATLKQRAMAVGAQMKMAHQLRSAEHISQRELERVLSGSLQGSQFEVEPYQIDQMVDGIMKAGDPEGSGVISFVSLIQLLSKHRLYISESGLIARYGKTKGAERDTMINWRQKLADNLQQFFTAHLTSVSWFLVYLSMNLLLFLIGVLSTDRQGWQQWAYGSGPVLSMNCVLVLLPTLSSLIHAMRNSSWMNKVFPLLNALTFHIIISLGILFWTGVHLLTHFVSFAVDDRNTTEGVSTTDHFRDNLKTNIFPTVTGFIILIIFATMALSSIKPIRKWCRFIPFYVIHWVGAALFYLLLILHGVNCYNPSFWKWFIPAVLILALERLYRYFLVPKYGVVVKSAGPYDEVSRVAIVEVEKPKGFRFEAGQYLMLNIPLIGLFNWHPCHISSGPKDDKLTIFIPREDDIWFTEAYAKLKNQPYHRQPASKNLPNGDSIDSKNLQPEKWEEELTVPPTIQFTGPYGPGSSLIFDYKISTIVCGGNAPHASKAIIKKFLEYRKGASCACGCHPTLTKLYFVWVIPSGNDFEWFSDYLSELCEDEHLQRYLDIRVFLTNIDSPPDELASALLQLGLKTAGDSCMVRRPSQPQLNNLYHMTSYGLPDFDSLLDYIYVQHSNLWNKGEVEFGVFSIGQLHHTMQKDLKSSCNSRSKPGQLIFRQHHIVT